MDVSIIIVNYNTLKLTHECINSVIEKTRDLSYEIILVDNASTDGSREYFEKDNRIVYIYSDENLGFGRANNKGVSVCSGRNILYLNSDTLLKNNAIKILSDYLDANSNVGACGGNLYHADGSEAQSYMMYLPNAYTTYNRLFLNLPDKIRYGRNAEFNHTGKPRSVAYITGADLMVKRSVLEHTGGFDERFFMYFEECELCNRITKSGYKIMSIPSAEIIHLEGASGLLKPEKIDFVKVRPKEIPDSELLFFRITSTKISYKRKIRANKIATAVIIVLTFLFKRNRLQNYITQYRMNCIKLQTLDSIGSSWNI